MTYKMMLQFLFVVLITPSVIECVSVVGPRVLRPFSSYRVAISGGSRPQTLFIAVEGRRATGEQFSQGREVQVQTGNSRLIDLDIVGDPGPGQYVLLARSTSGPQFSSSAPLIYQPRSFCIFVQTDKRVYQPGDVIKFRVIALDKYLLPLAGAVDVSVLDSGGSPVRQWAAVDLTRGLLTEELLLADEPALGEWSIQVEVRGQKYSRQIMVADYVMPKFQMDMQMPKEILFADRRFTINVTAKHFNGLPVRGELTLSAYAVFFSGLLQPVFSSPARKVVDFNGGAEVTYDLKTDLDLAEDAARPLVVEAVLEEKNTLIRQNVSARILLLRTPYRLKVTAPDYFKPELPYNVQIEVVDSSGKIMENVNEDTIVERLWDDGAPVNITNVPLKNGFATYTLVPDKAHINSTLNLVVKYKGVSERVVNIQRNEMSGGQFLSLEVLTRGTSVGDVLRARIIATEPMDLVHYAVIGRGDILVAKTLELNPAKQSVDISVPITINMAPGCVVLAWYPRLDSVYNTVLSASVFVPQKNLLQHKVSVVPASATAAGYRPNGSIELRVSGEPDSQAALLGVDINAITAKLSDAHGLGSGLDMQKIEREVESFIGLKHSVFKNEDHLPGLGLDLGGYTSGDVFKNAGVVILAEGVSSTSSGGDSLREQPETGTRPPLAGPYAFSRLPPPPSPRYYLTVSSQPTWSFTNVSLGYDGKGTGQSWSPSNPGEWIVGAFAVHPTLGLGLASPQSFTTNVPLTITAELPATLQRGETLAAVIILKSSLTVDTSVEVTFHNSDQYFEFEPLENNVDSSKKIELFRRVRVTVPARGSVGTAFLVTVVRNGEAPVIVEATGNGVSASLFRTIDVKDGFEEDLWTWGLLDARRSVARSNVTLEPIAGTRVGPVSLLGAGTLMAGALHNRNPAGVAADPPHALRPLALATVLLDYLQMTDPDETTITMEARSQIAAGFQRLMAYRRGDGSFAAETDNDAEGDPWMTAVALRWLSRSARYVEVTPVAAAAAARWLTSTQQADGSWRVPVKPRNDPRAQAPLPLTAHALLALLHTKGGDILYQNAISKAVDFLARGLDGNDNLDAYSLAVMGAAFGDSRHPFTTKTLQMMDKYSNASATTLFWSRKLSGNEWRNPWLKGNSFEATTAAWGLKAMLASKLVDEALPVARYLLQVYRPQDQDPEVLDALAQFADAVKTSTKLRISVNVTGSEDLRQINIDDDNALFIQTQLVRNARSALAVTEGRGIAVVGLSAKGSTNVTAAWPRYTLDPRVDQVSTKYRLQLSICVGFVPQGNETESGLTLLTVQLPSGYLADINTLTELTAARHVVSARLQRGGARVVAWMYTRLSEQCTTLIAPRALPTARQRPGWATLEDLYDSSHRARVFFQPIQSTACDACREWDSCSKACGSSARQQSGDTSNGNGRSNSGSGGDSTAPDHAAAIGLAPIILIASLVLTLR